MGQSIKILIVDDHPFFRQGVTFFLNSLEELELVGEAENGEQAVDIISDKQIDVVLMDLQMPGMDGISATSALLKINPYLRILILTSFGNDEKIQQALMAGASGYCLKDAPPEELITAIKAVASGGTYLGRGITPKVLAQTAFKIEEKKAEPREEIFAELTEREVEVLDKLAQGLGNKDIARELVVSEKTVKTHVANILQKLEVKTRTQAALLASKHRLKGGDSTD